MRQLLLKDFTVLKIMLAAVATGMLGVHALSSLKLAQLPLMSFRIGSLQKAETRLLKV